MLTQQLTDRYTDLPEETLDQIEDLADDAIKSTLTSSAIPLLLGIGVGGGVAALSGMPIVGALAGSYFIYSAISSAIRKGQEVEYLKTQGRLAHSLKEPELIRYAELLGPDAVADEIAEAYRDGKTITPAARKFLVAMGRTPHRRTIDTFMDELKKLKELPDETTETPETPATPYFDETTGAGSFLLDVILKSPGISRLMIGGQRTGKSYFAAVASRILAQLGWKIYHVNLASYGDEDSYYWHHVTRSVTGDLASITDETEAKELIEDAIACLNEFWAEEKALFICDEITYAGSKFGLWEKQASDFMRLFAGRISALTSTGMKRHKAIWSLCPELVAGALKDSAKSIKSLQLVLFAIAPGRECKWKDQIITFNSELYSQVASNFSLSMPTEEQIQLCNAHSIDRIVFIDNEWTPIGTLPVLEPIAALVEATPDSPAALLSRWKAYAPTELFARAVVHAFVPDKDSDLDEALTQDNDPEYRTWKWAWQKLSRFPEGKTPRELWNDAPKSLTSTIDREEFDKHMETAIEVGLLFLEEGKLTHNPELQP